MIKLLFIAGLLLSSLTNAQVIPGQDAGVIAVDTLTMKNLQTLSTIQNETNEGIAKLKAQHDSTVQTYDSFVSMVQGKIDSLQSMSMPTTDLIQELDRTRQLKETKLSSINTKLESLKARTIERIDALDLPPELKARIDEYKDGFNKLDFAISSANPHLPSIKLPGSLQIGTAKLELPDSQMEVLGFTRSSAPITPNLQGLNQAIPVNVGSLEQLGQLGESQFTKVGEVSGIADQLGQLPANPLSSEEQIKDQLLAQANKAVVDHFAGMEIELKAAMDQIAGYKRKYASINSLSEIKTRPRNEMKGKLLRERIVPGLAIQLQKKDALLVDMNPYAGYRFSGRISAGLGWNERLSYNLTSNIISRAARIYGPRAFGEFKVRNGFSSRVETEIMNTYVPHFARTAQADRNGRQWVPGAFLGIKKDYKLLKNVHGTALVMVRLFDQHHTSPYADTINARFGFEFPMKKKVAGDHTE